MQTAPDPGPSGEQAPPAPSASSLALQDPVYREAVVDLLGAIAYGEISAFDRLAQDSRMAPELADRAELARMAATEFSHYDRLCQHLRSLGADPVKAMERFVTVFDAFHTRTASSDWLEGLVTAYVGDGLAADFFVEIAAFLDSDTRGVILDCLVDTGNAEFAVERVRAAISADPRVGGRLALWGRRLMGEALTQAQRVAADRESLTALLTGGVDRPGLDLAAITRLFARLTENHTQRMHSLGLDP